MKQVSRELKSIKKTIKELEAKGADTVELRRQFNLIVTMMQQQQQAQQQQAQQQQAQAQAQAQ